jgi:hypothetical protein
VPGGGATFIVVNLDLAVRSVLVPDLSIARQIVSQDVAMAIVVIVRDHHHHTVPLIVIVIRIGATMITHRRMTGAMNRDDFYPLPARQRV